MSFIDQSFGISPQVLSLREQRFKMIAGNLANSDTPGYKAVDLGFEQVLAQSSSGSIAMRSSQPGHQGGSLENMSALAKTMYRVPTQPTIDGNTVETTVEHSEFMKNAIRYQASLGFLDSRIQGLRRALRGE